MSLEFRGPTEISAPQIKNAVKKGLVGPDGAPRPAPAPKPETPPATTTNAQGPK